MRNYSKASLFVFFFFLFLFSLHAGAQTYKPGYIIRQSTSAAGKLILNPNGDDYASKASLGTAGFGTADIYNSEVPYKTVKAFSQEPNSDLRRGPNRRFSDYVPDSSSSGYYMYFDQAKQALMFRMRMGSIVPGAKGFSVLIDADGKFGATGPNADPNYEAATTGVNGNPGFEIELVLTTQAAGQVGLEIINVDGTSNPTQRTTFNTYTDYSQVSIAGTNDNGDPDFYLDWYVPWGAVTALVPSLNLSTSSSLRMIPTTVMAPKGALGGPKSDIYGLSDANYKDANAQYEAYINMQPSIVLNQWQDATSTTSPMGNICTAAPVLTAVTPGTGSAQVTVSWTRTNASAAAGTARVYLYKNGSATSFADQLVTSGTPYTFTGLSINGGDVITAKAQASNESMCYTSNAYTATTCNSLTRPAKITNLCVSNKGASGGGWTTNHYVSLWRMTAGGMIHIASGIPGTTTNWANNGSGAWAYSGGCAGNGNAKLDYGTYIAYDSVPGGCISAYAMVCNTSGNGGTTQGTSPAITISNSSSITPYTASISGTYTPVNAATDKVRVYVDSVLMGTATLASNTWSYTFSGANLRAGQVITVTGMAQETASTFYCQSTALATISCGITPPVITTNAATGLLSAGQTITGTSPMPAGTWVVLYNSSNTRLGLTTVQSDGSWTMAGATYFSPFTGTAVAGISYYAKDSSGANCVATSGTYATPSGVTASGRCGTITSPATIYSTTTSLSVAYNSASSLKIMLFEDGQLVDSSATRQTGSGTYNFNWGAGNYKLYAGNGATTGVLSVVVQEWSPAAQEAFTCPSTYYVVTNCTGVSVATPSVSPASTVIAPNHSVTYTLSNLTANAYYSISDNSTGNALGAGVWATDPVPASVSLTTANFTASTVAKINAMTMIGSGPAAGEVCYAAPATASISVIGSTTDLDDDDDGIPDTTENGGVDATGDADADGIPNYRDANSGTLNAAGVLASLDKDGDGIINQFDLDSDNDGIPDLVEAGGVDTNGDGRVDFTVAANDSDNDGLVNIYDASTGGTALGARDTDGDGIPDYLDLDSDDDGIADITEAGGTDANNDGKADTFTDTDSDGYADALDGDVGNDGTAENTANTLLATGPDANNDGKADSYTKANADGDSRPNPYDLDSDNDGIPDLVEQGGRDTNGNGMIDVLADADGNGWQDSYDPTQSGINLKTLDANSSGPGGGIYDFDGDGVANYLDLDSDNDGIPDIIEQGGVDSNNDGKLDATADVDNDGFIDSADPLNNNTSAALGTALITTGSTLGTYNLPTTYSAGDNFDGTGLINMLDLDADGDGILDAREAGLADDTDNNGIVNGTKGADGWSDNVDALGALNLPNTDNTGGANYLDIDADNDGITDNVEGQTTAGYRAPLGTDTDADGIDDRYDNHITAFGGNASNGITPVNTDGIDNPDYTDTDTDNDGQLDIVEGNDFNNDGLANDAVTLSGTDSDNDGLDDLFENTPAGGPAVTIAGFSGPAASGRSPAQKSLASMGADRDWRYFGFLLPQATILPVRFVSVKAALKDRSALVSWTVAEEENVLHYEVERSTNGTDFVVAGTVAFDPVASVVKEYRFDDSRFPGVRTWYRIRQVDIDGKFMYSATVSVDPATAATASLSVSPNPLQSASAVSLTARSSQKTLLVVYDWSGRVIHSRTVQLEKGRNLFPLNLSAQLPAGTYILNAVVDGTPLQVKLVK
ncbi:T9SS type A sorting domain-containing protein [Paraflavisolibacter sp. H34]|uniref:T9SS type A sorting domain-containing protein n=1 Tax=Huijunlia imazamoxiresistens TaxID=3127457 RepID=UPI00301B3CCB